MNIVKWLFNSKYRFFYRKVRDVQYSIWEWNFKVAKARQIREGIRQDRDRAIEGIQQVSASIQGATDTTTTKFEQDTKDLSALTDNKGRYEAQMKMIDEQITGIPASGENPGQQGIMDTIKGLVELQQMYKEYIANL